VGAKSGVGASTVARAFALEAAKTAARGVWLVELDLLKGEQHAVFNAAPALYGPLGPPGRSSPSEAMFFTVTPKLPDRQGEVWSDVRYLAAQAVGGRRLWVTRFRREALEAGQSVRILKDGAYWETLREHADYVVVDAPALERSPAAGVVAPFMEATVLVVSSARRDLEGASALRDAIAEAGGRCAGVVLTGAPAEPPAFLKSLSP
jgi:hypothetical protein